MADGSPGIVPPSDLDAEAVLLSTAMLHHERLDELAGIVSPADFYADANRRIFEVALEIRSSGQVPTLPTIAGLLRDRGQLASVGGAAYLAQVCDGTPATAYPEQSAVRVAHKARQRALIDVCKRLAAEGYGDVGDVPAWLQDAESRVYATTQIANTGETLSTLGEAAGATVTSAMAQSARKSKGITGISTGFGRLDKQIDGLQRGCLYTIAARPGMGKTGLAVQLAVNVARGGKAQPWRAEQPQRLVVVISLEMPREQLAARTLAQMATVDAKRLMRGNLSRGEWSKVHAAAQVCASIPLVIDEAGTHTPASIRSAARRGFSMLKKRWPDAEPGLVVVDYIQIVSAERHMRGRSRDNELGEVTGALRQLAKELDCPVVMLSQLNRDCEKRPDKRPVMSDLRESGSIEQDSFAIMMLFRADQYQDVQDGSAEVIVRKIRQGGSVGTVQLSFDGPTMNFFEPPAESGEYDEFDSIADNYGGAGDESWRS